MAKKNIPLLLILLLGFSVRLFGINWDQGFHLHPDERMIVMVADKISFFKNLNPNFFNYGSLPIYLLRIVAPNGNYDTLLTAGRILSVLFESLTIIFIYKITSLLFKDKKISLLASFFYIIAFFPIQNSHFFVVDGFLTTFTTILIYLFLKYLKSPSINKIALIAIVFAAMMATKFTAIIFLPLIIAAIFWKTMRQFNRLIISFVVFVLLFLFFNFFFMPYTYLNIQTFITDISLQIKMNSDPYIFPYTLQYVGTLPYFYYLKNIFLWGLGPFISVLSLLGFLFLIKKRKLFQILFILFYLFYFLIIGRSSVKFMRYMLPLYPFLTITAGYGFYVISRSKKSFIKSLRIIFLLGAIIWTFLFVNIYFHPHTRILATDWILKNVPAGSNIAIEHWDDRLPLYGGEKYNFEELTLYNQPDDNNKWQILNQKLKKTDYIIIASNRLYIPLQKLSDCNKYKLCYPKTANYYKKLFNNQLSFRKVAEFVVSPLFINDQSADESFTVYDHPKIMIYKNLH